MVWYRTNHRRFKFLNCRFPVIDNQDFNDNGGVFTNEDGEAFCATKWVEIIVVYEKIVGKDGECTVRCLQYGPNNS